MKKIYYLRLWLIAAMLSVAYSASAYVVEVNGIIYKLDANTATASVTKGDGKYVGEVVIPSEIKMKEMTYSVTEIGSEAFEDCFGLTSVTIPNSVTKIDEYAFYGCSGLTSVTIPNSVTEIGEYAFGYCSNLISVTIPESVISIYANAFDGTAWYDNLPDGLIYIGKIAFKYKGTMPYNTSINIKDGTNIIAGGAFEGCFGLTSVTIPNSVTKIGDYAFYGCTGLTSVIIPNSVTKIGDEAFNETAWYDNQPDGLVYIGKVLYKYKGVMPDITSITIKDGTINITPWAFDGCSGLTSVIIPESVTEIGESAFYECSGLTSVIIPNSVTEIGRNAFGGCSGLTSLRIGNSVKTIGSGAFWFCTGLTSVTIPNSVTSIGDEAFSSSGLTSVTIPNSVTSIGESAFSYCKGLTSVTIPNSVISIGWNVFCGCTGLTSVTIPNSVTSIGESAFSGCTGITKITIPKTVKYIGSSAFDCNYGLEVYVEWDNLSPELLSFAQQPFSDGIMQYGTLYVPTGTKALYGQTEPWKNFLTIKQYVVDGIEEIEAEGGVTIDVEGGKIVVNGAGDAKVEVFGTNGAAVYSGLADKLPELAAGIYVVRVGSTVKKVAVTQ